MIHRVRRWTRLSSIVLAAAMVSLLATPASAQKTMKVGVVAFLSGAAAGPFGIPGRNGAEVLVDAINAGNLPAPYNTKGFGGVALEPVYLDENGPTTKVVEDFRNLVQRQNVDVVIGYISSGSCLAITPVAEE